MTDERFGEREGDYAARWTGEWMGGGARGLSGGKHDAMQRGWMDVSGVLGCFQSGPHSSHYRWGLRCYRGLPSGQAGWYRLCWVRSGGSV
jgi:hypothetical protein